MSKLSEMLGHFALDLTEDASAHSLELADHARELESEVERLRVEWTRADGLREDNRRIASVLQDENDAYRAAVAEVRERVSDYWNFDNANGRFEAVKRIGECVDILDKLPK